MTLSSIVILLTVAGHLITLWYPGINFEFSFADASNYFLNGDPELLKRYFKYQANTLALPYFTSLILSATPISNPLVVIRLLNLIGIVILAVGIINICTYLKKQDLIPVILVLTFYNPLVWAFSGRATADFLPMAMGIFCISVPLFHKSQLSIFSAGVFFGIACAIKYHALCLIPIGAALICLRNSQNISKLKLIYLFLLPSLAVLLIFLTLVFLEFGYWVVPQNLIGQHNFKFSLDFIDNFFGYIGLLSLLSLPTIILSQNLYKSMLFNRKLLFCVFLLLLFIISLAAKDHGEMNLGPLDQFVSPSLRFSIYIAMSMLTVAALLFPSSNKYERTFFLSLSILFVILVFSFARPAQRYLLYLIPFFLITIPPSYLSKKIFYSSLVLFLPANIFIEEARFNTANSSLEIVKKIKEQNLMDFVNPGVVTSHVGYMFKLESDLNSKFTIVYGDKDDAIITVRSGLISLTSKTLSVVPVNKN